MTPCVPALGFDMAKRTFDVHLLAEAIASSHHFANTPHGFEALDQWLGQQVMEQLHACTEATGTYGDALTLFLYHAGHTVSIINPARMSTFRLSEGRRTKTDKQDAKLCALLISLPGSAELSAARLLAEIVDIKRFKTVKQLVVHAGIAPQERSSGTSVRGKACIGDCLLTIKTVSPRSDFHISLCS